MISPMKKNLLTFLVIAILVAGAVYLLLAGKSGTQPSATPLPTSVPSSASESESEDIPVTRQRELIEVVVQNFAFSPAALSIKPGTTVKWTNRDSVEHTVTSEGKNRTLNSKLLGQGESFTFTFNQPGVFSYLCTPHPNMSGSVTVTQ